MGMQAGTLHTHKEVQCNDFSSCNCSTNTNLVEVKIMLFLCYLLLAFKHVYEMILDKYQAEMKNIEWVRSGWFDASLYLCIALLYLYK